MNRNELIFTAEGGYPPINISERNPLYAQKMLDNMGGANSEMSAVSLYFYNNLMTDEGYEDVAYIFHKISIVEMHHLEIFGKIARAMGEDPRLWTWRYNRRVFWTPSYNNYPIEFSRLIHNSLNGELAAIEKYQCQVRTIENECIVANLQRIIRDEQVHVDIFNKIIEKYNL